jgi:hypothetical protein
MTITAESAGERPVEPFRTFLFIPKHEAECLADIAQAWLEGAQTVARKQAEVGLVAMEAGAHVVEHTARAFGELSLEASRAFGRAMARRN